MRVLLDLCHPADVHFFREVERKIIERGHDVIYTARDKDVLLNLCEEFNMNYNVLGGHQFSTIGKGLELINRTIKMSKLVKKRRVDVLVGFGNPYIVLASKLCDKKSLFLTDTENSGLANKIGLFATTILTPEWFTNLNLDKQKRTKWFKELSYINEPKKLKKEIQTKYVIVRKVAWTANHDRTHRGLDSIAIIKNNITENPVWIIKEKHKHTSSLRNGKNIRLFHKLLANASVVISEGATTAAEAALMGIPTIYVNTQKPGYILKLVNAKVLHLASDSLNAALIARKILESEEKTSSDLKSIRDECIDIASYTAKLITGHFN